mgnify:FL=1
MEEEATQNVAQAAVETVAAVGTGIAEETKSLLHWNEIAKMFGKENLMHLIVSVVTIIIFFLFYKLIKRVINKHALKKSENHTKMLVNKTISYIFYIMLIMYILSLFGVNLTAIWGAAGIAGVAIGFAAQTSVSNFISGLFVLGEKSMKIGDYISVGDVEGNVDEIGLLSVKIRTLNNQMIRVPTSTIINANLTNYTHFEQRRLVFEIPISYESDMEKALKAIETVPASCPTVLQEPAPKVYYDGFGEAINLRLAVWFNRTDLLQTKNDVYVNIMRVCREQNVVIPYSRIDVKILNDENKK